MQLKGKVCQGFAARQNQDTHPGEVREERVTNTLNVTLRNLDLSRTLLQIYEHFWKVLSRGSMYLKEDKSRSQFSEMAVAIVGWEVISLRIRTRDGNEADSKALGDRISEFCNGLMWVEVGTRVRTKWLMALPATVWSR